MPLLPPEPCLYPETLLDAGQPANPADERRWWVLHTRPRAEKSLARTAFDKTIPFFLPVYTRRWRNAGRWFSATLPLFPGYFFVKCDEEERERMLETRCVANSLVVVDQHRLHDDLSRIHGLMKSAATLRPEDRLSPGTRVVITGGPLKGLEGTILRVGKQLRLVVAVDFVKKGVSVEIESWMVTALPDQAPLPAQA